MDAERVTDETLFVPSLERTIAEMELHVSILHAFQAIGYDCPSQDQRDAITSLVKGHHVFVVLPTGSGKSLCFVALPLVFEKVLRPTDKMTSPIVVVISPLTSLMKDQVKKYGSKGVRCTFIGDECSDVEREKIMMGEYSLVYASPESLLTNDRWRAMFHSDCYQRNLVALVVDEAHCVQSWGKEFRTEYDNISELRSIIPKSVRVMALTATVTPASRKVIMKTLCLYEDETVIIERLPNKKNIKYEVRKKPKDMEQVFITLVQQVQKFGENTPKTIVFCRTYKELTEVSSSLINSLYAEGVFYVKTAEGDVPICQMYSASTTQAVKDTILPSFTNTNGSIRIVIATIAFGMGLDAPNVRQIIHWGPSDSVEAYLQESGRAGRDGESASAVLYYSPKDVSTTSTVSDSMKLYCGNTAYCRRKLLLKEFGCELENLCNSMHSCCDICKYQCNCDSCSNELRCAIDQPFSDDEVVLDNNEQTSYTPPQQSKVVQDEVHAALVQYRDTICTVQGSGDISLLFGKEISSGIPDSMIRHISKNCTTLCTKSDFESLSIDHASDVFEIVKQICDKHSVL